MTAAAARIPLVAGNWKMHLTHTQGAVLAAAVVESARHLPGREIVVCPPFTTLPAVAAALVGAGQDPRSGPAPGGPAAGGARVALGAQNVHWEGEGAYTGEVSVSMLRALGCRYVIVGHSERRALFGESDRTVARKARAVCDGGLVPVVCVGETLEERDAGRTEAVVARQLGAVLEVLEPGSMGELVVAYEPVWAIGTGRAAEPADADAVARVLRRTVAGSGGPDAAGSVRILYGGSVKPENAAPFLSRPDIDGALVGGASLDAAAFTAIAAAAGGQAP